MVLPERKHPRLKDYDYGQCGCCHVTICTKNHRPILSRIIPADKPSERAQVRLTRLGTVTQRYIHNIERVYTGVYLDKYVIMPNHVHLLITLDTQASASIPTIVRSLKRMINREAGGSLWQDSFYDVVVRNDAMFRCEWEYIDGNPDKWTEDDLFVREADEGFGGLRASRPTGSRK